MGRDPSQVLTITISADKLEVSLSAGRRAGLVSDLTPQDLDAWLKSMGVTVGIDSKMLGKICTVLSKTRDVIPPVVVAQGRPPAQGEDGCVRYHFSTQLSAGKSEEGGRMDFRDRGRIQNTEAGKRLATVIPPKVGEPGLTVTGEGAPWQGGPTTRLW